MMKWLIVSISCILLAVSPLAAQEQRYHLKLESPPMLDASFKLEVNGIDGVWFPMPMARSMLADVQAFNKQKDLMLSYEEQLNYREQRVVALQEGLQLQKEVTAQSKAVVDEAMRMHRRAEEKENSLFAGKPGIWAMVGSAVTGILIALLK